MTYAKHLEQVKARQHRYVDQGLCRFCGSPPRPGISERTGRSYTTCQRCYEKTNANHKRYRERKSCPTPSPLPPIDSTSDKIYYLVIETGEIGQLVPCPSDDPVILEFKGEVRDAFHLRELNPTTHPVTYTIARGNGGRNRAKGRPKGITLRTVEKMLGVYRFLETQSEPAYRATIEKAAGFNCTRPLMHQPSQAKQVTLESLGIVKRLPGERTWVAWTLTELGRTEGESIIKSLKQLR